MFTINAPYRLFISILFTVLLFTLTKEAKGQKTYATGTITGGLNGSGILAGSPYGLSRTSGGISTVGSITTLNIPNSNVSNFYYAGTIKTTSGAPTGVGSSSILGSSETVPILVQANKGLNALLIPVSGANSFIQFRYTANVPAKTTSYLKLKEKPIRNSTVDVAALGVLGLASSNIVIGEVYSGALQPQDVFLGTTNQNTGTALGTVSTPTKTDLVVDKNGEWYAAVMPTATGNYNSVRLTAQFPADLNLLSLANTIQFNVYNAFTDPGANCNFRPLYTTEGKASGITLDVGAAISALDLSELVKNPTNAIDDDINTYASISSGIANVGLLNSVSQSFYFDHKSTSTDELRLQLGLKNSLVDLDLLSLNGITLNCYNGGSETPVFSKGLGELTQLIALNLLDLVTINGTSHKKLNLTFTPGVVFDRVEITFNQGLLGVGLLGDAMRIYDVSMGSSLPTITVQPTSLNATNVCEDSPANFTVTATATGGGSITAYQWQYLDGASWVNAPSETTNTLNIAATTTAMNNRWYRVKITGGNSSCPQEILSNEVKLTVNPRALASDITSTDATVCPGVSATLSASTVTVTSPSFKWYSNAALTGSPLSTTNQLSITPTTTTSYWVTVQGTGKCENAPNTAKQVTVTVNPPASPPALTVTSN